MPNKAFNTERLRDKRYLDGKLKKEKLVSRLKVWSLREFGHNC